MPPTPLTPATPLGRLRLIGLVEGTSFLVLLLVAMPLRRFAGLPEAVTWVGTAHGGLFMLFVASVVEVTLRVPWYSPRMWLYAALASVLPGGTFVFDWWLQRRAP